ncbi:phosphotyrosine protein phosphatase [Micrococcus sp.]|uniref:arsenate-mycothiol transferase ArsC n=1 Tax=Micrococcus sp. TaxID=1271 RepID=UPI002A91D036|nr:phosphotyrosine protein phosphatase [Micrococcus sp.]MDY6054826.1 phosphotyrosine protein phosphatase [Micrococcus sp.]
MTWTARPPIRSPFAPTPGASAGAGGGDAPLRILTVCTGNICRSAYAQHVLQARLDAALGPGAVEVSSAGRGPNQALSVPEEILGLVPEGPVREALAAHRPRMLTAQVLQGQHLVLAATDAHLEAVLREAPAVLHRCLTMLDAGTLFSRDDAVTPGGGPRALSTAIRQGRSTLRGTGTPGSTRGTADLPDPFRGPAAGYTAMAQALDPALEAVARAVERAMGPADPALGSGAAPGSGPAQPQRD